MAILISVYEANLINGLGRNQSDLWAFKTMALPPLCSSSRWSLFLCFGWDLHCGKKIRSFIGLGFALVRCGTALFDWCFFFFRCSLIMLSPLYLVLVLCGSWPVGGVCRGLGLVAGLRLLGFWMKEDGCLVG